MPTQPFHPEARAFITAWFDEAWSEGLWAASWSKSLEGLSAQQAAWTPAPGRPSIWQIVLHMVFWRESHLRRAAGGPGPTKDEVASLNWPRIDEPTEPAWAEARRRFEETQQRLSAALRGVGHDAFMYFLPHDCYHFGQISYLRAMQGFKPIE